MNFLFLKNLSFTISLIVFVFYNCYSNKQDSLRKVIDLTNDNRLKIQLLNELSHAYLVNVDYEKSIKVSTEALNIAKWENYNEGIINAYRNLGHGYYFFNNYVKALENYLSAIRYLNKTTDYLLLAKTYGNIAIIYNILKKPKEAIKYNTHCLKNLNKQPDSEILLDCYVNFSDSYGLLKDHENEIGFLKKVLEIKQKNKDFDKLGIEFNNLGAAYWKAKMFDSALVSFTKYLDLSYKYQDSIGIARAYTNIGVTYYSKGNVRKSIEYYNKSLELNTASNNYNYTYIQLIYANLALKALDRAERYFYLAIKEKASSKELQAASDSIRKKYELAENISKAYQFAKIRDSISSSTKKDIEASVKLQYEVDGIEARLAEKENYKLMQENLQLRSEQNKFLIAILILIFIIGTGGIYLIRKRLKEREKRLVFVEEGVEEIGKVLEDIRALRSAKNASL